MKRYLLTTLALITLAALCVYAAATAEPGAEPPAGEALGPPPGIPPAGEAFGPPPGVPPAGVEGMIPHGPPGPSERGPRFGRGPGGRPGKNPRHFAGPPGGPPASVPGNAMGRRPAIVTLFGLSIPIVMALALAAIVIIALWMGHRGSRLRYETLNLAIKEGKELPPQLLADAQRRRDPLMGGLMFVALGIGLGVALGVTVAPPAAVWGLIPLLLGVAMLIYMPLSKRLGKDDQGE